MDRKKETTEFHASAADIGTRLDAFVAQKMPPHVSRSRVKTLIKSGNVTVNDVASKEPNFRLKGDEIISLAIPEPEDPTPKPEAIPLVILHEDEHLIVINKPAGMVVHPAAGNWTGTLVNALLHHCGDTLQGIGGVRRPGIVHRLDKETSGVMVVAKTEQGHAGLTAQFADHGKSGPLKRAYLALVWGALPTKTGTIDAALGRSRSNRIKRAVVAIDGPDARHAVTHYTVQQEFLINETGRGAISMVECRLETGRTHQIRVHMSHIGHPLVGDQDYGAHFQTKVNALPEHAKKVFGRFRRQALHAATLGFEHPVTGAELVFNAPVPDDFQGLLDALSV